MADLTFRELRKANISRNDKWHPLGVMGWTLSEWALAVTGELGEACNKLKKLNRARDGIVGNSKTETPEQLREDLGKEIADVAIYLDLFATACGFKLGDLIKDKFNETSEKNGFEERL